MTSCQAGPKCSLCTISLISLKLELLICPFHKTGNWGSEGLRSFPKVTQPVAEQGLSPRLLLSKTSDLNRNLAPFLSPVGNKDGRGRTMETEAGTGKLEAVHSTFKPCHSGISSPPVFPLPTLPQHLRVPGQVPRCPAFVSPVDTVLC